MFQLENHVTIHNIVQVAAIALVLTIHLMGLVLPEILFLMVTLVTAFQVSANLGAFVNTMSRLPHTIVLVSLAFHVIQIVLVLIRLNVVHLPIFAAVVLTPLVNSRLPLLLIHLAALTLLPGMH